MKAKRIFCVVAYDIQADNTRSRVAKKLEFYGTRANYSVFECMFTPAQLVKIQAYIELNIDKQTDSVIFYRVCVTCFSKSVYLPDKPKKRMSTVQQV